VILGGRGTCGVVRPLGELGPSRLKFGYDPPDVGETLTDSGSGPTPGWQGKGMFRFGDNPRVGGVRMGLSSNATPGWAGP
jgi:hypothetical protein